MKVSKSVYCSLTIIVAMALIVLLSGFPLNAQDLGAGAIALEDPEGDKLFEQDPGFPECLGPEDPFCPSGFPGDEGGGGDGSFICQYCDAELVNGQMEFHCKDVNYGEEGWTECSDDGQGTQCGIGGVGCGKV